MPMVSSRLCLCCSDVEALPLRAWKIVLSISASIPGLDHSQPQLPVPRTLLRFGDSKNQDPQGINWANVALAMRRACATKQILPSI